MVVVGMHEAKTHLSALVERVAAGEDVLIQRRGVPVARLVAAAPPAPFAQTRGMYPRDELWMADDFDELPDDIADAFGMR